MTDHLSAQIFLNGSRISSEHVFPTLFSEDQIFVFESLRSYGGIIFRLEEHLDRLFESAKTIGVHLPKTRSELRKELTACLTHEGGQDRFLRLALDEENSYIWIDERKRPGWIYEKGIDLQTAVTHRNLINSAPPEAKTSAFLNGVLAFLEKGDSSVYESIFLDQNGYLAEATVWNLFIVKGRELRTPQVSILHGVTRQFVIKCAHKEGIPTLESNITRHDSWNADEAFLTNTSGEIAPVRSLDGRMIGKQIPGEVTKALMARFQKDLKKELKSRAN
ncbi:MAG: hypothetical protein A3C35_06910 [Omnitrophica bacterium RIFCSPHIGHO2_02_FULL_46_11]|nr:MAG: hypothetical protein A3C35_06910 [Omnitrophica bacterium RIFCSPHIGHO2_02_FULL_46_11]OGW86845.1 MAG: hypothetical protein A3A81_01130 [Omnitrophica bacterium RIFCSPLOWO2_01_FULL_45_10b]